MGTTLLSSATSGMLAAQIGLQTAEHNISNQNTLGFNRQRIIQASNLATLTGSGFIGQGAHVSTVERMYDRFLAGQVNSAQTSVSQLETYYNEIAQIDNMLADPNSGLTPALESFFSGVQQVAANPAQLSSRQAMISSAQALVSRYQGIESRLQELYEGINSQLVSQVDTINSYAQQIAELNQSIIVAQSSSNQPANDLLDQRDQIVSNLNKLVKVDTMTNTDGSYSVFFGTGQQLVVGTQVMALSVAPSSSDPTRFTIGLRIGVTTQELPESLLTGGSVSGLLQFRSEVLDKTANDVGRSAASLALAFNAQNALGQDLLGQSGADANFVSNFFSVSQPRVVANSRNSTTTPAVVSASLAAPSIDGNYTLSLDGTGTTYTLTRQSDGKTWSGANLANLLDSSGNSHTGEKVDLTGVSLAAGASTQVSSPAASGANFYTKLTTSDYRLSYNAGSYTMTRLSDNQQWTDTSLANLSATMTSSEGFSLALDSGTMANGDSFLILPTREAARNLAVNATVANDARLVAAGMPIKTSASSTNSGTGKISTGATGFGFGTPALTLTSTTGVGLTYNSTTGLLTVSGAPVGANISVSNGTTTTIHPGPTIPYTSGATISFAGVSFSISGNLANGDTFTLSKNTAGVSDSRNASLLAKLQTQYTMSGETASFASAYAQLVSDIGNKTQQVSVTHDAQQSLLEQSESAREALSGVNLVEEAANLIKYQQAYQASAKALQIGTNLFDTLIGIMN